MRAGRFMRGERVELSSLVSGEKASMPICNSRSRVDVSGSIGKSYRSLTCVELSTASLAGLVLHFMCRVQFQSLYGAYLVMHVSV